MTAGTTDRNVRADTSGAALVEFALALPMLLTLIMGMLCYGQYIWLAHSAQAMANDAARATMAGLNSTERLALAKGVIASSLANVPELRADKVTTAVDESAGFVTVRLRVDARQLTLLHSGFVPLPEPVIERRSTVPLGGAG